MTIEPSSLASCRRFFSSAYLSTVKAFVISDVEGRVGDDKMKR